MSTNSKLTLFVLVLISLVIVRYLLNFSSQVSSGQVSINGEVSSVPYLQQGKLNFRVGSVFVSSDYINLDLGDRVTVNGNLKNGKLTANKLQKLPKPWWEETLSSFRTRLKQEIYNYFPDPQASLLTGITLGQNLLPKDFKADLVNTGTIHVVVVSGYNIALVGNFVLLFASYLGRRKALVLALLTIFCYSFLVGLTAPTLRALVMGSLTLGALTLGKKALALYTLLLSSLFMLLINPNFLTDISFQLTFLATLGVMSFTKPFENKLKRLNSFWRSALATTLAAQALVIPVLFYYFGTISLLAPVVNTLVLWVIPLSTLVGFIFLTSSLIFAPLATFVSLFLLLLLTFFTQVTHFFSLFKMFVLSIEPNNIFLLVGYYLLVTSLLIQAKTRGVKEKKLSVLGAAK